MCAETMQAGLVAYVAKPVAKAGRRERLAVRRREKRQMLARRRVERGLQLGNDRKPHRLAGALFPHLPPKLLVWEPAAGSGKNGGRAPAPRPPHHTFRE